MNGPGDGDVRRGGIAPECILAEADKIAASNTFHRCARLRSFLKYIVGEVLRDCELILKEYHLGTGIFGKPATFDPRSDPIVRVEVRRLRQKLRLYYDTEGAADAIEIAVPVGTYAPVFRRRARPELVARTAAHPALPPSVAVLPFKAMTKSRGDAALASALAQQIAHAVRGARNVRVMAWHSGFPFPNRRRQLVIAAERSNVTAILEGSVWPRKTALKLSVELVRVPDGRLLWSQIYERGGCADLDDLRELAAIIASEMAFPEEAGRPQVVRTARAAT